MYENPRFSSMASSYENPRFSPTTHTTHIDFTSYQSQTFQPLLQLSLIAEQEYTKTVKSSIIIKINIEQKDESVDNDIMEIINLDEETDKQKEADRINKLLDSYLTGFVMPKEIVKMKRKKFTKHYQQIICWYLRELDYVGKFLRGQRFTEEWKYIANQIMNISPGMSDPGKKVRNHFLEILQYGEKQLLTTEETKFLVYLVHNRQKIFGGDEIPWSKINKKMRAKFGKPFGGGRLKDDWHNFASQNTY